MIRWLKRCAKPYRLRITVICVLTVLSAVLQVINALLTRDVVDAALNTPRMLPVTGVYFALTLLLTVAVQAAGSWLSGSTYDHCVAQLRQALLRSLSLSEEESRYPYHSGSLLSRAMEDVRTVADGVIHALPSLVGQVARLAAGFVAVVLLFPAIAGVSALVALAAACAAGVLRPLLKKHHKQVRRAEEKMSACMQEDLWQLELVKSLGAEEQMLDRFRNTVEASLRAKKDRRILSVSIHTVINGASNLATVIALLWGAGRVAADAMSYGSLTAMLQLLSMLRSPVMGISGIWTRLTAVEVAAERLDPLLIAPQREEKIPVGEVKAIVFDCVTFAYPGETEPVLKDFSAVYPLDKWLCISGVSGRGKSTLFKLILGLYRPQAGTVCLRTDGGDVPCGARTRYLFAYIPQDYGLLSGSVLDNLLLAAPDASPERRRLALELACAGFVYELPEGEDTPLRENNDGLSKGQLQRIAVARAVLMERPVLLMDECTSALDAQTEEKLLRSLHTLPNKAIVVTHRPGALKGLDGVCSAELEQI